jgi:tetratricopeptide (TPR) repeat protein
MVKPFQAPAASASSKRQGGLWRRVIGWTTVIVALAALSSAAWFATHFDPLGRARTAYECHQYRTALLAAKGYLNFFHGDPKASLMAARCLTRLGKAAEAEVYYQRAEPLESDVMHDRAEGLLKAHEPRLAARVYETMLEQRPNDGRTLKRLAFVLLSFKQWAAVLKLTDRLTAIPSEEISGLTMAAIAYHESKDFDRAANVSLRVLELDPNLTRMPLPKTLFWKNLATDLMGTGRAEEARENLNRGLAETQDAGMMELLGLTYFQQGSINEAERSWRQAIEWNSDSMMACLHLGRLALSRGEWTEAADLLKRAADRSTTAVAPLYNLSQAYRRLGKFKEAEHYEQLAEERRQKWTVREKTLPPDLDLDGE